MKKKYGLRTAKEWLETEYNGGFYLHDAPSSTFMPYCYLGEETLVVKYQGKVKHSSFRSLYSLIQEDEVFIPS